MNDFILVPTIEKRNNMYKIIMMILVHAFDNFNSINNTPFARKIVFVETGETCRGQS